MQNTALVDVLVLIAFLLIVPPLMAALLTRFGRSRRARSSLPADTSKRQPPKPSRSAASAL